MEKKVLFGLDKKGGFKVWEIYTEGDTLFISHGKEGGKMQLKEEKIKGKNIGRANETTPAEQAELEAMSRWRKQIDKGYRENKSALEDLPLMPMLANDYLKQGHRINYPCYGSPKLDGVRCLAIRHEDRVELKSRGGKEYIVEHVQRDLMGCMLPGDVWDGELYIHGKYLEEITSAVKKFNLDTPSLKFIVFDVVTDGIFEERLQNLYNANLYGISVKRLEYDIVENEEEMKKMHKFFVSQGYEGIMLRNKEGIYESGKRSADLQKYKEFFDEEFIIIGVLEDTNGNAVLEVFDNTANCNFSVCYGDFEERKRQLKHPELYIGKPLTVKYQTRYKDSKLPQFPVGVSIREGRFVDGKFYPET